MFAKAWVWLLCIFLSACTKAPTLIVIHTTQSWMGHIIAGVRVEPLFQGPSGQTQPAAVRTSPRSEEHTSELQSRFDLVCRLLLEKKNGFALRSPWLSPGVSWFCSPLAFSAPFF